MPDHQPAPGQGWQALRALGVSSPQRSSLLPNVPIAEQGVSGYEFGYWNALYAPAGTPAPIINRLNELMRKAMASETVRHYVAENGMEVKVSSPDELAKFQAAELERWGKIIKTAGIQPE
ncbi:Bug family tripartite tricarboxylate transporter substrate binding protein [Cupriavidus necator]|uniref:Bug family tripartite tricarboxylate transporter substrate binding protein n=1 Tax=Cupriavidus necator TaxID=106590 RepID=UPI002F26C292